MAGSSSPPPPPPPPPDPSKDTGALQIERPDKAIADDTHVESDNDAVDIFTMTPVTALKLMCERIDMLAQLTGDVPPTPPVSHPTTPITKDIGIDRLSSKAENARTEGSSKDTVPKTPPKSSGNIDSVHFRIASPESPGSTAFPVIGGDARSSDVQTNAVVRKFYSKRPPPIPLEEYLLRMQQFCPTSTAVYLATSLYIHRLAVVDKILLITRRNVHRLVLAGLRVAMKALEDLRYGGHRFSKVGGVSQVELGRLEISFCFVMNFELRVTREMLHEHAIMLRNAAQIQVLPELELKLPVR
ncbi:MAG: hypothetical protein M1825_002085 [Sarcosagium campestre]|nr:MAG: hypothetical protein M1825_002085 [Sarcosagium campestre]